ncbi:MAG: undecaprenyl-diphosphate phosphatase [Egibacteraceae bacterium]
MIPVWLQAVVLGVVQGLSEFMPISSDGHLVLVPFLLGWEQPSLSFIVALHIGTLAAVLLYFRRDLAAMLIAVASRSSSPEAKLYRRLIVLLAVGSVPVALLGLTAEDQIQRVFSSPAIAATGLFVTAALLVSGEKARDRRVVAASDEPVAAAKAMMTSAPMGRDDRDPAGGTLVDLTAPRALLIGAFQSVALLPGVSRSGSTISGGMFAGLTREAATRFSFLLSIPALIGAAALNMTDLARPGGYGALELLTGIVAAFGSGYAAIRWLVALVARERLTGFAWYCLVAGLVGLLAVALSQ